MTHGASHLDKAAYTHVIALVHGINDVGAWQATVSKELSAPGVHVAQIRFGPYSAPRFLFPVNLSERPTQIVVTQLQNLRAEFPNAKISVIAHSFGTYVMQRVLRRDLNIEFWKLVFCGSVADDLMDWAEFKRRVGDQRRPTKDFVINDCGTGDYWPLLAAAFSWRYGMAGATGFNEVHVTNRFHRGESNGPGLHSLYFQNDFVRTQWRPFLIDDLQPLPGNGVQGEHLSLSRIFYKRWARFLAAMVALALWILLAIALVAGFYWLVTQIHSRVAPYVVQQQRDSLPIDSPLPYQLLPQPTNHPGFPTSSQVTEASSRSIDGAVLYFKNRSTRNVRILLYNCALHYRSSTSDKPFVEQCFKEWPIRSASFDAGYRPFSKFGSGSSWFGIYICDLATSEVHPIGFFDFTTKKTWRLDISGPGSDSHVTGVMTHE